MLAANSTLAAPFITLESCFARYPDFRHAVFLAQVAERVGDAISIRWE
jgi:hypothetical protein